MRKIEAIIRPEKLEPLRLHLKEVGYSGMMITEIEGHGRQGGVQHQWRGTQYKTTFLPKVRMEMVVPNDRVNKLVSAILDVCHSGNRGDGKILRPSRVRCHPHPHWRAGDKVLR